MTGADFEKAIIALTCYLEADEKIHSSMTAIACVLQNRAAEGWFDGGVVLNSYVMLKESKLDHLPDVRDPEFQKMLLTVDGLMQGRLSDKTGGAMYYVPMDREQYIYGTVTARIGKMIYYK